MYRRQFGALFALLVVLIAVEGGTRLVSAQTALPTIHVNAAGQLPTGECQPSQTTGYAPSSSIRNPQQYTDQKTKTKKASLWGKACKGKVPPKGVAVKSECRQDYADTGKCTCVQWQDLKKEWHACDAKGMPTSVASANNEGAGAAAGSSDTAKKDGSTGAGQSETTPKTTADGSTANNGATPAGSKGGSTSGTPSPGKSVLDSAMYDPTPISQQRVPIESTGGTSGGYDPNMFDQTPIANQDTGLSSSPPGGGGGNSVPSYTFPDQSIGNIAYQPPTDQFTGSVNDQPPTNQFYPSDNTFSDTYRPAQQDPCATYSSCAWQSAKQAVSDMWAAVTAPPASTPAPGNGGASCPGAAGCPGNTVDDAARRGADLALAYDQNRVAMQNAVNERGQELTKAVDDLKNFDESVNKTYPTMAQADPNIAKDIAADRAPLEAAAKEAKQNYDAAKASYDNTFGPQNPFNEAEARLGREISQQYYRDDCPAGTCSLNQTQRQYGLAADYLTYDTPQAGDAARAIASSPDCNTNPALCAAQRDAITQAAKTNELNFPQSAPSTFDPLDPRWYYAGTGETPYETASREAARTASGDKLGELSRIAAGDMPVSGASPETQSLLSSQTAPASGFWPTVNTYAGDLSRSMTKEFGRAGENIASFATYPVTAVNDAVLAAFGPTTDQQRIKSYFQTSYENALDRVNAGGSTVLNTMGLSGGLSPRELVPRLNPFEGSGGFGSQPLAARPEQITPAQVRDAFKPVSDIPATSPVKSIEVMPKSEVTSAMQRAIAKDAAPSGYKYVYSSMPAGGKVPTSYAYGGIPEAMRAPAGEGGMLVRAAVPESAANPLAKGASENSFVQRPTMSGGLHQSSFAYPKEWFPEQAVGTKPALAEAPAFQTGPSLAARELAYDAANRAQADWTAAKASYDAARPYTDPAVEFQKAEAAHIAQVNGEPAMTPRSGPSSLETAFKVTGAGLQLGNVAPAIASEARAALPSALERTAYTQTIDAAALNDPANFRAAPLTETPSLSPAFRSPVGDFSPTPAAGASVPAGLSMTAPLAASFEPSASAASAPGVSPADFDNVKQLPGSPASSDSPFASDYAGQQSAPVAPPGIGQSGPVAAASQGPAAPGAGESTGFEAPQPPSRPSNFGTQPAPSAAPSSAAPAAGPGTVAPADVERPDVPGAEIPPGVIENEPLPQSRPSTPAPANMDVGSAPRSFGEKVADVFTDPTHSFSIGAQAAEPPLYYRSKGLSPQEFTHLNQQARSLYNNAGFADTSDALADPAASAAAAEAQFTILKASGYLSPAIRDAADVAGLYHAITTAESEARKRGTGFPISSVGAFGVGQLKAKTAVAVGAPDADIDPLQHFQGIVNVMNENLLEEALQHPGLSREELMKLAATDYNAGLQRQWEGSNAYGRTVARGADTVANWVRNPDGPMPSDLEVKNLNPKHLDAEGIANIQEGIKEARERVQLARAQEAPTPVDMAQSMQPIAPADAPGTRVGLLGTDVPQPARPPQGGARAESAAARPATPAPAPTAAPASPSFFDTLGNALNRFASSVRGAIASVFGASTPASPKPATAPGGVETAPTGPVRTAVRVEPGLMHFFNPMGLKKLSGGFLVLSKQ